MQKNHLVIILAACSFVACSSDPLPEGTIVLTDRPFRVVGCEVFALDVPEVMAFTEGEARSYTVTGVVPQPGSPVIEAFDLPSGATFDRNTGVVRWEAPAVQEANVADPSGTGRVSVVRFVMTSNSDSITQIQKRAVMVVKAAAR